MGFALAMNCIAIGLGAGIIGVSHHLTTISIGAFSLISISIGSKISNNNHIAKYSNLASGLLLILICVYEIMS